MSDIRYVGADMLVFDKENPRLVEYNISKKATEEQIAKILWREMNVEEIVMSILANGFYEYEPMYGICNGDHITIVEGNRRLAAVKAILEPESVAGLAMTKYADRITDEIKDQLNTRLPVIIQESKKDSWRFIGFKHVKGTSKWDSYAKAKYIADIHNEYDISLDDIAEQIGDKNQVVKKYYQALMILNQANRDTDFRIDDVYYDRVFFSHLYTAIGYDSYRSYLGFDANCEEENPIPSEKKAELEQVMFWLFGSKSRSITPVIQSQNPDLRNLGKVLEKTEAIAALQMSGNLDVAYEASQNGRDKLQKAISEARQAVGKALANISYYKGEKELLAQVGTLANSADSLYDSMKRIYDQVNNIAKEPRITE